MRKQDTGVLYDLHPQEFGVLYDGLLNDQRLSVIRKDGLSGLLERPCLNGALAFALVDPSYENKGEFDLIQDWLAQAMAIQLWDVLLIWYPKLSDQRHVALAEACGTVGDVSSFDFALANPKAPAGSKMFGSGMGLVLSERLLQN